MLLEPTPAESLPMASVARSYMVAGKQITSVAWDWETVRDFAPTVVIDCAFLTRDLVVDMSLDDYVERNRMLTSNLLRTVELGSVTSVITISSGAAVYPVDALTQSIQENPYGYLKREAEQQLNDLSAARGVSAVIARAWSVSGAFVQKPLGYAFSDMILQARDGSINIRATMPVYRRYAAVEDLLAVSLAHARTGGEMLIDSGGQLVEMQELAEAIVSVVNPTATITRASQETADAHEYYAAAELWERACAVLSYEPAGLPDQIRTAAAGIAEN